MLMSRCRSSIGTEFQTERDDDRESPSAIRAQPLSWDDKLVTTGGPYGTLSRGNVRHWRAIVRQVPRSFSVLTSV